MAPMRHRYDTRLHKRSSGYGRPMAPRANNEMAPGYGTDDGSGQAYGNGQYAGGSQAGPGTQQGSSYGSSQGGQQNQQGSSRQGSPGAASYEGAQEGSQQNTGSYGQRGSGQQNQASQQNTGSYEQVGSSQQNSGSYGQSGENQQNPSYSGQRESSHQNAAGQQTQQQSTNDGSYQSNAKGATKQQSSPDTSGNKGYESNYSPQNGKQSENEASGTLYGNANNANEFSEQQQQKSQAKSDNYGSLLSDPSSAEKNESPSVVNDDSHFASQQSPELKNTLKPSLATDSLLPTDSATATVTASTYEPTTSTSSPTSSLTESATSSPTESATSSPTESATSSPTASPTTSSSASPTATPATTSNGLTAYQSACAGFGVALGVVVIGGAFLFWLYRRRRQQKSASAPTEQFHDGANTASTGTKPRPSEKLHSTFHEDMSSWKSSAAKKGHKARGSVSSAVKRASSLYGNFVGTAVGTGSGALDAVRNSLQRVPQMQQHQQTNHEDAVRSSNEEGARSIESHEQGPRDWNSTDKGNASTPTLVVSPTDGAARDASPTVRHVPSGRPQMERSSSVDDKAGISTTPETDTSQGDNQTGNVSPTRGQNLLAITSMVPFLTSQYRVEIAFSAKKPGQLDLRDGQCVTIRQSYDDGWVLCSPSEGVEGFAPRACLSPWPVKSGSQNNSDGSRTPDSVSAPGTPRFYSHFFSTRSAT